jgi:hypothetical protein
MPDWERFVAERLAESKLAPEVQREVAAEIAAHLDECHTDLLEAGSADAAAQTRAQVSDWHTFCRRIRRSKEDPMSFARKVVIPGIAAVIVAMAALKLFVFLLITPTPCPGDEICAQISVSADGPAYLPWLITLPFAGALAAMIARRLGARPSQRLLAATFPAFYLAGEMVVVGLLSEFFWRIPIYWVLIPALVCAVGAAPFLGSRRDPIELPPAAPLHP